jgi:hypothetical protein
VSPAEPFELRSRPGGIDHFLGDGAGAGRTAETGSVVVAIFGASVAGPWWPS